MTSFASFVDTALQRIEDQQLITGELLSLEFDGARWKTRPYPLWSAIAHDALCSLDSGSTAFNSGTLNLLPREESRALCARVAAVRWRLRTYLAWEEEAGGAWKRCGRHSASPEDAATTACAATALLPVHPGRFAQADRWRESAVRRFIAAPQNDRVARGLALRFLAQSGASTRGLRESVIEDCENCEELGADLPWFAWGTARAWRFGFLPGGAAVARTLLLGLEAMHRRDPSFGGIAPLAFALSALLNLHECAPPPGITDEARHESEHKSGHRSEHRSEPQSPSASARLALVEELLDATVAALESPLAPDACIHGDSASPAAVLALLLANTALACIATGRYPR